LPEAAGAPRLRLPEGMSAAEIHSHTDASDGMVGAVELVEAAVAIGLSVLCITDHDCIGPMDEATDLGRRLGVDVVRGQEVTCAFPPGVHLLGLFLERPVRMNLSVADTVDAIHDEGGLAIIAHPFMPTWFASITEGQLRRLLNTRVVDGIEARHTALVLPAAWARLDRFCAQSTEAVGALLGAGDSHFGRHDLGRVVTAFPGRGAADLRRAVEGRLTSPMSGVAPDPPSLGLRLAQQRRSLIELNLKRRRGRVGQGVGPEATG
jgi:predicted metal-dependent phosphoesterase TrpH